MFSRSFIFVCTVALAILSVNAFLQTPNRRSARVQVAMNDFRLGGFKISVNREEEIKLKPKPKPKSLFSIAPKKDAVKASSKKSPINVKAEKTEKKEVKVGKKAPKLKAISKSVPVKQIITKTKPEKKEKPKSVYKPRSTLKTPVMEEVATKKSVAVPSLPFKLPSAPASLSSSKANPAPAPAPAVSEGAFVRPQSTYSARIASYVVFVIFLYFFVSF